MPTKRTWGFLILTAILYFLANQTQVGWIYVMVAGILALLAVNFFYTRGMLSRLNIRRTFSNLADEVPSGDGVPSVDGVLSPDDAGLTLTSFFEDDPIEVKLQFQHAGLRPAFLLHADKRGRFFTLILLAGLLASIRDEQQALAARISEFIQRSGD